MPRRQTCLNQIRGAKAPTLLVDGGDCFFLGSTIRAPSEAEETRDVRNARVVLGAYNALGYQALGIGPGDLQYGLQTLRALEREARFPFLCANVVEKGSGNPLFKPYVILPVGALKIGIYAVLMGGMNDSYVSRVLPGAEVLDPFETTRKVVEELRDKCDLILALSHLNGEDNEQILEKRLGIDMMVDPLARGGTKALWVNEGDYCKMQSGTIVLRVDGQGSRVGLLQLYFEKKSKKPAGYRGYDIPLEPHILRHPEMTRLVERLRRGEVRPAEVPHDPKRIPLVGDFLGQEGCGGCHEEQLVFWRGTKHASAFATLEKSGDQNDPDCFLCHSYGYGVTFVEQKELARYKEVQCESCHGMTPDHATNPQSARMGAVPTESCWGCHNRSITGKAFAVTEALSKASCPKMKR